MDIIHNRFKSLKDKGFFHIFGSSSFSLVLSFLISILVVRQLDKTAYGLYSIANNTYSYFALFIGIGLISGIMQFCSEKRDECEKEGIYSYSLQLGTCVNAVITSLIILYSVAGINNYREVNILLLLMSGFPLFTFFSDYLKTYIRIHKLNKAFSYINIIAALIHFLVVIVATKYLSIYGYIISTYVQQIFTIALCLIYLQRKGYIKLNGRKKDRRAISNQLKHEIVKYSIICCITNLTSTLLSLLDVTCLNQIIGDASIIASYKVALAIPNALMFIPNSYIVFIYPYLAESNSNATILKRHVSQSLTFLVLVNAIMCVSLYIGAEFIVDILWGEKYIDCVPVLKILIINYFISGTFRKLYGNVIAVIRKVKINFINTATAGLLNIGLNIILIKQYNSIGAAIATLIVTVITSGIAFVYVMWWFRKQKRAIIE